MREIQFPEVLHPINDLSANKNQQVVGNAPAPHWLAMFPRPEYYCKKQQSLIKKDFRKFSALISEPKKNAGNYNDF